MSRPPYWPYRCRRCARFVSNPTVKVNEIEGALADARGDCSRCGSEVELAPTMWEDWFGWPA